MKQIIIIIVFFSSTVSYSQWINQDTSFDYENLRSIQFTGYDTGYIVGSSIYKTTDGAGTWIVQNIDSIFNIVSVYFINSRIGYGVGMNGTIVRTINGGANWISQISGTSKALWALHFVGPDTGYIVGDSGIFLRTFDGGNIWTTQILACNHLSSVYFVNHMTGYIADLYGEMLKTTDGGSTWNIYSTGVLNGLSSLFFTSTDTGYIVGGEIIKTTDGGITWSHQTSFYLTSVCFVNRNVGYCAGWTGKILKTIDGGLNWIQQNSGTNKNLHSIYFINKDTGYVAGENGTLLKTANGGMMYINEQQSQNNHGIVLYPNPANERIYIDCTNRQNLNMSVYNLVGTLVMQAKLNKTKEEIDIRNLVKGTYIIKIIGSDWAMQKKMIKE